MCDHQAKPCLKDQGNDSIQDIVFDGQKDFGIGKELLIIFNSYKIHGGRVCCPFEHTVIDVKNDRKEHKHGNQSNRRQQKDQQVFFVLI